MLIYPTWNKTSGRNKCRFCLQDRKETPSWKQIEKSSCNLNKIPFLKCYFICTKNVKNFMWNIVLKLKDKTSQSKISRLLCPVSMVKCEKGGEEKPEKWMTTCLNSKVNKTPRNKSSFWSSCIQMSRRGKSINFGRLNINHNEVEQKKCWGTTL